MIDSGYLSECVTYNAHSGIFTFNERPRSHFATDRAWRAWNARFAGRPTGSKDSKGHVQVKINGRKYLAHRLAFILVKGAAPDTIDHKDRNKTNNAWHNLRAASRSENAANRRGGIPVYRTRSGKYRAQICVNYKVRHIGTFETRAAAVAAYKSAAEEAFGEFFPHCRLMGESAARERGGA